MTAVLCAWAVLATVSVIGLIVHLPIRWDRVAKRQADRLLRARIRADELGLFRLLVESGCVSRSHMPSQIVAFNRSLRSAHEVTSRNQDPQGQGSPQA